MRASYNRNSYLCSDIFCDDGCARAYTELQNLNGKIVRFISDCILFENFDITCKVLSITIRDNIEYIFKVRNIKTNKIIKIGSNMSNLQFEIV